MKNYALFSHLALLIVASFVSLTNAQAVPNISTKEALTASIQTVPCERSDRREGVEQLFLDAGASPDEIEVARFEKEKVSNVIVRKKGKSNDTIVIGAHYDRTASGCGVIDNWTGVAMITHIYRTLRPLSTEKSYVFVAFDREGDGLIGSKRFVKEMEKSQVEATCSMVNFDSFGQARPMALRNASSSKLVKLAETIAEESELKFQAVTIEGASSDSASFKNKKIPAITFSGLGSDWQKVLHTSSDQIDKVDFDSVYLGYRFGLIYIAKLDAAGCAAYK